MPVGSRQHQVQQDQGRLVRLDQVRQLSWVAGHDRGVAGRDERVPRVAQRLRIVVDDQDAGRPPLLHR